MNKDYGSWSLTDLKTELRKRNANLGGKKAILIQRLNDYDKIFGPVVNEPENTYLIQLPEAKKFLDLTRDSLIPPYSQEDLETYAILAERDDIATGERMYREGFLLTARCAEENNECFIIATCASEMRKQITYKVSVKYVEHCVQEAQCECAAGMGPFAQCKHVILVQCALVDYTKTRTLKLRASCTSTLQTFHHPGKYYTGNPVEAKDLVLKSNNISLKNIVNFDPRPSNSSSDKENYVQNFKSTITNFCCTRQVSMPLLSLTKAADKKSLYKEHDYLEKTQEEIFLESMIMSEDELKKFEEKTKKDKSFWKRQRLFRIHSSNFGKICKTKPNNKAKLTKSLLKGCNVMTAAIKHGIKFENAAVNQFTQRTGLVAEKCGIFVHPQFQYLASTPDRLLNQDAVLEVKCPFSAYQRPISPETVPYLYLCHETGDFKLKNSHDYYYQIQGQLLCTGRKEANFCVYSITDFIMMKIERDEEFISQMTLKLRDFYENFYRNYFLDRHLYNIKF